MEWWKQHEHDLPHWSQARRNVLLVQPSSAATESIFQYCLMVLLTDKLEDYTLAVTKYLGSSIFNSLIMESELRK